MPTKMPSSPIWPQEKLRRTGWKANTLPSAGPREQMRRLLRLASALTAEEMHSRIEFLSAWG